MTHPPTQPIQLQLFPTAEDSLLYGRSPTWQSLSDNGRAVVRSYLLVLSETGRLPSQSQLARASGLSRHAVSLQLGEPSSLAWRAITELLASCRDDLAARSSIAIPYIAVLILRQFLDRPGHIPRSTSSLTRVELDVLKAAGAMGGIAPAALSMDAPLIQLSSSVSVHADGDGTSLSALVAKLRASQLGQLSADGSIASGHPADGAAAIGSTPTDGAVAGSASADGAAAIGSTPADGAVAGSASADGDAAAGSALADGAAVAGSAPADGVVAGSASADGAVAGSASADGAAAGSAPADGAAVADSAPADGAAAGSAPADGAVAGSAPADGAVAGSVSAVLETADESDSGGRDA